MTTRTHLVLSAMLLSAAATLHGQEPPCGVSTVKETTPLIYPPIARAAHVTGLVIVRASFATDGRVVSAEVWRGPEMLRASVLTFVNGLHANEYGGSRTCMLTVTHVMRSQIPADFHDDLFIVKVEQSHQTPLNYTLTGTALPVYTSADPAGKMIRHRFLGIF